MNKKLLLTVLAAGLVFPTATASAEQYADVPGLTGIDQATAEKIAAQVPTVGKPAAVFTPGANPVEADKSHWAGYEMKNHQVISKDGKTGKLTGDFTVAYYEGQDANGEVWNDETRRDTVDVTIKNGKVYDEFGNLVYIPGVKSEDGSSTKGNDKPGATKPGATKPGTTKSAVKVSSKAGSKTLPKTSAVK